MPPESATSCMALILGVVTDNFSNPGMGQSAYAGTGVEQDVLPGRITAAP